MRTAPNRREGIVEAMPTPTLWAGASVVTITPPLGTPLSGYFTYRPAKSVAADLTARSLVLDDGATRVALVVGDLIAVSAAITRDARARIAERVGIPATQVMIACTHTHTGPMTGEPGGEEVSDPDYLEWLAGRIADGVAVAAARLAPAQLAVGAVDTAGICFNRRIRLSDGRVTMNWGLRAGEATADGATIVGPAGPVDPQVTALLVEDAAGEPIALWASLSTHYVGVDDDDAISPDFYGDFANAVRRLLGDGCVPLLANGTSGNINSIDIEQAVPWTKAARSRLVGRAVAAAAVGATAMARRQRDVRLATAHIPFTAARRAVAPADVVLAERILAQPADGPVPDAAFAFAPGDPVPERWRRLYAAEALAVTDLPEAVATELQVVAVGDLAIVALPGEIFVEHGLAIKAASPFPRTVVVGLANADIGYVPTEAAFGEGAYETWTCRSAWVVPGTGEAMVAAALDRLRRLRT